MKIIITDSRSKNISSNDLVILWCQYDKNNSNYFSIPKYIEDNCDYYKSLFLEFVADLSKYEINKKSILQTFQRGDDFNFWWLTSIEQKFNIDDKSGINNSIKLLALRDVLSKYSISSISVISSDYKLQNTINEYCLLNNIKLNGSHKNYFKNITILNFWKSIIFIAKYVYFSLIHHKSINRTILSGEISFFDIFVHLKEKAILTNKFHSSYWNEIVEILRNSRLSVSWVHLFYSHKMTPKFSDAKKITQNFNKYDSKNLKHLFIEDHLSIKIILKATLIYLKSFPKYYLIYRKSKIFLKYKNINFYYLLKDDFNESLFGKSRITNEIRLLSFDSLFRKSIKQKFGFYLQENQPWEIILISKWRKYNHGIIFGVPHSTVRYWDLRYFDSIENFYIKKNILPDSILVNSLYAYRLLKNEVFNKSRLLIVEALRYQHLVRRSNCVNNIGKVIVFGDFQYQTTKKILDIIQNVKLKSKQNIIFYFKQHPAFYFDLSYYDFEEESRTTEEILFSYNVVITSDISSTSAEAYSLGLKVIQYLDGSKLNFSPIKGLEDTNVFMNTEDLYNILENREKLFTHNISNSNTYFFINKELTAWKKILQID